MAEIKIYCEIGSFIHILKRISAEIAKKNTSVGA